VPERGGRIHVQLDREVVLETGQLKPQRLTARASADLHHPVLRHHHPPRRPSTAEHLTPTDSIMPQIRH
jgi:hypothetical protein